MSQEIILKFKKLNGMAFTAIRATPESAGLDLFSPKDYVVPRKGKIIVETDIGIELPYGCYGRIAPRSGLAVNHYIDVGAGVIDQDYRGNLGVVLFNFSDVDFHVKRGDRVAQLILERIFIPILEECHELNSAGRGNYGYGSTGN